ncbi:MAG: VIT family protein [Lautropia mirabilis]|nr:VIT family protein [Lautropia mirabilis]
MSRSIHPERHYSSRNNWLRAGVLGANDGLISTASLLMGLVAGGTDGRTLVLSGIAALVAGAVSTSAGEYVSVSSQSDTERADLAKERQELDRNPETELRELTSIYESRGLDHALARQVAEALTRHDDLQAHARDEIGLSETIDTNPLQAAWASALAFICGAILPVLVVVLLPVYVMLPALAISTLAGLAGLGWLSARLGGAPVGRAVARLVGWGVIALLATYLVGDMAGSVFL